MTDKTEEIRLRHLRLEDMRSSTYPDEISDSWTYFGTWAAHHDRATLLAKVERLRDQIERLRAALKPFAAEAEAYDPPEGDDAETAWFSLFTCGNLRDARNALEGRP